MNARQFIINSEQSPQAKQHRRNVLRAQLKLKLSALLVKLKPLAYYGTVPVAVFALTILLTLAGV